MKISKILLAILAVFVFAFIIGSVTCGGVFSWVYKVEPTAVWKLEENISFPLMILDTLFTSVLFVIVYAIIHTGLKFQNKLKKGFLYGLIVYSVGFLPGIISTYTFMNVADIVIIYWLIWGIIVFSLKGVIAALVYGE